MITSTGTKNAELNSGGSPSVIIDKGGKIIALSTEFKKLIPAAGAQSNFFELFDEEKLLTLQRIFIDVRKFETVSKDTIYFENDSGTLNYDVIISPLRSENNVYFIINFHSSEQVSARSETQKFWIASSDLEKITDDKKILSIIKKIKLTFPFTFIEKAKVQKEINELEDYFWIKDTSSKYILVNDKFAESLGFKVSQIENKSEDDLLPKYLINLYRTIDSYIINSTNSVIINSIASPITGGTARDLSVVQFPLCDLDNNVVALIGFSKKSDPSESSNFESVLPDLYRDLPIAVATLDKELKFDRYSNQFVNLLGEDSKVKLAGRSAAGIFERKFFSIIEDYVKNEKTSEPYLFNYVFIDKLNLNAEIRLEKIFTDTDKFAGVQISIIKKIETDSEAEAKAKMYDAMIQHSPIAMFIYDIENLKFLEVNDVALKLYGYKRSEFLNMDLTDLYAPEDIQTIIEAGESKSVEGIYSGPWRHKKNDGTSVLVELNRTSIEFKSKKSHLNIVRNVSEQADQKRKYQLFETAFENTSDPIITTDKDGFILAINDQVTKKLGLSKKDLENRPFITLVSDDDRAKVNKKVFHSGLLKTASIDVNFKKTAGSPQPASIIATPIKNYNGEIESFCLIIKIAEETSNAKDADNSQVAVVQKIDPPFLSNIFHEILTPINVILGFTQELGESINSPNDEQKEAIAIIKENQKLLLQIMDNAVEYSTLEQKIIKIRPEEFKFIDILEELKDNSRKTAEDKNVVLDYGTIPSSLILETDKLKFLSLISLFTKFAVQITKENTVFISASNYDADSFAVKIKDTRNSISPYLLKAFTEIFSVDENMSRRNYGFSRFSVKLAKKLIDLLSVRKETILKDGEPVEFALIFPLKFILHDKDTMEVESVTSQKKADSKILSKSPLLAQTETAPIEKETAKENKVLDLSQLSCLYLEDQLDSQMLFKVQFKDLKSIEFAQSFENALPLLKTKKFDFIVMDINLQGEYNGLDAMRIIQKMPGFKDLPIIASTAYVQPGARDNFIAAGFSEFVSKPLLREKLLDVLRIFFQK